MSDDEGVVVKKPKTIHYGSLEEQEKARLAALAAAAKEGAEDSEFKELGDIQISNEYMELEEEMSRDKKALLEEFERRRKARQLNVRRSLRQLAEPVCLFGEEAREDLKQPGSIRAAAKQEAQRKASAMSIYCSQMEKMKSKDADEIEKMDCIEDGDKSCAMASCSYDGTVTGRCVMIMSGHSAEILALDWDPSGHRVASASADHQVMSADISMDNKYIATCSYDRTFKLWAPDLA
ncbi:unnamed protein product [Leptidea sinapis]|uniref:Pre-mRNA processing factor 4 (PRP4)-like domain-containing protein n=1 Tax=Leptidea sinapis TaxID=189913 RepID=A0A5E4R0Y6_9NEOP|nr:unnamed protein product [Leptidea sinapis]